MILSSLIRNRPTCAALSAAAGVHLTLVAFRLPSWECPIRHGLGIPCPGCGMTRAIAALAKGDLQQALTIHAFAPIAVFVIVVIIYASIVPKARRIGLANWLERVERRTGASAIVLSIFLGYWLVRLLFFTDTLYQLVM